MRIGPAVRRLAARVPLGGARRRALRRLATPVRFGSLRRMRPLSDVWGLDRGTPIDRSYIEAFLARHARDIRGRVLEVGDRRYTDRFGIDVTLSDVLDVDAANAAATITADLSAGTGIEGSAYDCVILTQVLQYVPDPVAAVGEVHRILRPGGVLLATIPTISRIGRHDRGKDLWRMTPAACERLFGHAFGPEHVSVEAGGNVLSAISFLAGVAAEELRQEELAALDPHFPLVVLVRAVRESRRRAPAGKRASSRRGA